MNAFTNAPSTWDYIPRALAVLISRLCTADSAILVVFRGSLLLYYTLLVEYCCTSSISGICTAGTAKYWQYLVRLVLRVLRIHEVVPKYSHYAQYAGSMKYISTICLCTAVSHFTADSIHCSRIVPRMGVEENYFRGGELEYLEHWQYFGSICCEHSKYRRVQHPSIPTTSDVCAAGTVCCARDFVLLIILPVRAVFGPSVLVLLMYSQYSQYYGLQYYSITLSTRATQYMYSILRAYLENLLRRRMLLSLLLLLLPLWRLCR